MLERGVTIPVSRRFALSLVIVLVLVIPVPGSDPYGDWSYSIVHISDTQKLASTYPSTLNFTFSYLESQKVPYNITGIIVTGDLVNSCTNGTQWENYANARSKTTIPLFEVSGNHDIDGVNNNYTSFDACVGTGKRNWTAEINDFLFIGIGYTRNELSSADAAAYRSLVTSSPRKIPIFATHNYFDGTTYLSPLSPLGASIKRELVLNDPTFLMCGHIHGNILHSDQHLGNTLVEDMTNYQSYGDFAAGKLYTIYRISDKVVRIGACDLYIHPSQSLGPETAVYQIPFSAVFRRSAYNNWIFTNDFTTAIYRDHYGLAHDVPLVEDFNNDGIEDRAMFRGYQWIIDFHMDGSVDSRDSFGIPGDVPLAGDFNADGVTDRAVFRASSWNNWIYDYHMDGSADHRDHFGTAGDVPLVGDFNNDGILDRAVYRSSAWQNWIFDYSMNGSVDARDHYGIAGDAPVVGAFNEDAILDRAVFRSGKWIIDYDMDGLVNSRHEFGMAGDIPLVW